MITSDSFGSTDSIDSPRGLGRSALGTVSAFSPRLYCALRAGIVSISALALSACGGDNRDRQSLLERPPVAMDEPELPAGPSGGSLDGALVSTTKGEGDFTLALEGRSAPLVMSPDDFPGVQRVLGHLATDIARATGARPEVSTSGMPEGASEVVLVGTLGRSALIDQLRQTNALDVTEIEGRWETFLIQVVEAPFPGVERALVIAGSDKRATIYGMYELSRQIGVSPWHYFADVPVLRRPELYVKPARYSLGEPGVKYRGIFINDEEPALGGWVGRTFGGFNSGFYEKVFELLLRLRGNYLWPAMWGKAFNADDAQNAVLADEYGIVMGTSHHEPMDRAQEEWTRLCASAQCGNGEWNFQTNRETLLGFWRDSIARRGERETIVTVGMRGDGDEPLGPTQDIALLEGIIAEQRTVLGEMSGRDVTTIPQVWTLYKEVQTYYDMGMQVPDDITLMFSDDNFGNIRLLPRQGEPRAGGYGVYYHYDYVGGPRSYKWMNTNSIPRIWEQMHLAHEYGADRIWIVNVGDIKPMELPTQFFLDYAFRPQDWSTERVASYAREWAAAQFGSEHGEAIGDVLDKYTFFNARRKPELLAPNTYSLVDFREAERVVADYNAVVAEAERIEAALPEQYRDAFYQLVGYPVLGSANLNELYVTAGKNALYAAQGRSSTNELAARVRELFERDTQLIARYHRDVASGKWSGMMDPVHIGYTSWDAPAQNTLPALTELTLPAEASMGVAIEGAREAWPGAATAPVLPELNRYQPFADRYVEVFNRGQAPFEFSAESSATWLSVSPAQGSVEKESRLSLSVDWALAPLGATQALVTLRGPGGVEVVVEVPVQNPGPELANAPGFVESDGIVSIEAEHFSRAVDAGAVEWQTIRGLGRTLSGVTPFPVTAESQEAPGGDSPRLEYAAHVSTTGVHRLQAYVSPTLPFRGDARGLRYGVSIDDGPIQIINLHAEALSTPRWESLVRDNIMIGVSEHSLEAAGEHTLKFWRVDAGVVLQKLVLSNAALPLSSLGPPESYLRSATTVQ